MRSILKSAAVAAALMSVAGQALANEVVEISEMSGKVLVNMGNGYVQVPDMTLLSEGDTVMIGDDGGAIIVYLDTKCRVRLPARTVTTISLPDPCKAAPVVTGGGSSFVSSPVTWIALGGLAFAGGIALLIANHDDNSDPVSKP
jgi:hypothetical protein